MRHEAPELAVLGAEIRRLRIARGMTQDELGDLAEMHRNYVGMLERGERNPTVLSLLRLAAALEVQPTSLLEPLERTEG